MTEEQKEEYKSIVKVAGREIFLDPDKLNFNEATLNDYMEKEGALYNYYGQVLADAQAQCQLAKLEYEVVYSEKFRDAKLNGGTEKLSEASAKADEAVIKANKRVIFSQRTVEMLKNHLRAWDKNHDNAQSLGHMIRKEMDKLGFEIKYPSSSNYDASARMQEIIEKDLVDVQ
jgi:hypothetical protein